MRPHPIFVTPIICALLVASTSDARAWGKGHRLIRLWAVERLSPWQREMVGEESLDRLCRDYTSLQDKHAGGNAPELDRYCIVPDVRLSLHDVNSPEPTATATLWYLDQIITRLQSGDTDEAMKFLGVLCHWNEDPGCPSAHSSPINEVQLKTLLPPPKDKQQYNYLYGAGGIADVGNYQLAEVDYQPRLLGHTREEAALRIAQHQRLLRHRAATHIVPVVQDMMYGDGRRADEHRATAALDNARHIADVISTVLSLAADRFDEPGQSQQSLVDWLPDFTGGRVPHPYYVTPFLVNQAMDAKRRLHPLALTGETSSTRIESGYGIGTPFSLNFVLAPGGVFDRFTCRVGLHPTAGDDAGVIFAVTINDIELTRTASLSTGGKPIDIDIKLPRADVLRLSLQTIAVEGSAASHNLTVWGNPTLYAAK